jgi:cytochrome P450 family 110
MQNSDTNTKKSPNTLLKPPFWQKIHWIADPVSYMESAGSHHPDMFAARVSAFPNDLIFIQHPEGIQQILTNTKTFTAPGKYNGVLRPLLGDYSVIMLDGDRHRRQRKLLMPPFHGERMQAYGELICNLTQKVMSQISIGKTFSARKAMQEISLQVILEAVFGLYEGERSQKLKKLLSSMSEIFNSPLTSTFLFFGFLQKDLGAWSPWGNFLRQQQQIDELLYQEIAERREKGYLESNDILSLLMSARDEEGNPMTDKELRDELLTLMVAGHETTATAMSWSLYWIHRLPEVKEKLLQELDSLGESPEPMAIARLPYLTAVCNETLRISPVAMLTFPRVVQEPVELMGYKLEAGTIIVGCIYLTHQREDIYPEPKQFKPERFLERQFSPYEFLPFGGGVRRCIGEVLAQFEMKLVLATILSRYQLATADNRPERQQRRGVTLAPANGVKMMITGERVPPKEQVVLAGVS